MLKKKIMSKYVIIAEGDEELINMLQEALQGEYQQWDLYYSYKSIIKGPSKEDIVEEFEEHAEDEAEHIETVQRFLVSLGVQPTVDRRPIDKLDKPTLNDILELQIKYENQAVDTYTNILSVLEGNEDKAALRIEIENILTKEKEHAHDLELLLED